MRRYATPLALTLVVLGAFAGWAICKSSEAPKQMPRVAQVRAEQVLELPSDDSPRLLLSGSHELEAGQFLTAGPGPGAPEGFLLKVLSSQASEDETRVDVEPASLYEAVPSGSIVASPAEFSADLIHDKADVRHEDHVLARLATAPEEAPGSQAVSLPEWLNCRSSATMSLDGKVETALKPRFDLSWGRVGLRASIRSASARVDGEASAKVEARSEGEARCDPAPVRLIKPSWIAFIPVGPVVVPVTFALPVRLFASASAGGGATVSVGAGIHGSLGIEYSGGRVHSIRQYGKDRLRIEPAIKAAASARAIAGPEVTVKAGWHVKALGGLAAEAGVGIYSGVDFKYDTNEDPPARSCIPLKLSGTIGFRLPLRQKPLSLPPLSWERDLKCRPPKPPRPGASS